MTNVTDSLHDVIPNAISDDLTEEQRTELKHKLDEAVELALANAKWFPKLSYQTRASIVNFALASCTQMTVLDAYKKLEDSNNRIEDKINLGHFISYYGDDLKELNHLWTAFNDMKKYSLGSIQEDSYSKDFIERATMKTGHHIDSIFEMLINGNGLKGDPLWTLENSCDKDTFQNFKDLLLTSLHLRTIGLELKGETMHDSEKQRFQDNMKRLPKSFCDHCPILHCGKHIIGCKCWSEGEEQAKRNSRGYANRHY